jgi:hypothetical protein
LIGLAHRNDEWVVGFCDETWWSRLWQPSLSSWSDAKEPLRLVEQSVAKDDPDPKAVSCYGLFVPELEKMWLRLVDGRPVSPITTRFVSWCSEKLAAVGKKVWVLIWDNASWHIHRGRCTPGYARTTRRSKTALMEYASSAAFCPRRARG